MLEIRHLKSLKAIAETGKLGLAAERVFLKQSALSHQIRALETHYNIVLHASIQFSVSPEYASNRR